MTDKTWDIEKALAMAAGQDVGQFYNTQINEDDKQLLRDAIENIFQGRSVIKWTNGGNLQSAWNYALDAIRDEFFATSRRDIITIFLQHTVFEHRNKWNNIMMSNDNRFQVMTDVVKQSDIAVLAKHAEFQIQQGYETIKKIIQKYDNGFRPVPNQNQPMAHTLAKDRENEYIHERTK